MRTTLQQMADLLDAAPHLQARGALFSETVLLKVDGAEFFMSFDKGRIARIIEGPSPRTVYRFGLETDAEALRAFWTPTPAPGFHDIFAMVKIGRARIVGDILMLVKNLMFIKEVLALPRGERGDAP